MWISWSYLFYWESESQTLWRLCPWRSLTPRGSRYLSNSSQRGWMQHVSFLRQCHRTSKPCNCSFQFSQLFHFLKSLFKTYQIKFKNSMIDLKTSSLTILIEDFEDLFKYIVKPFLLKSCLGYFLKLRLQNWFKVFESQAILFIIHFQLLLNLSRELISINSLESRIIG